MRADRSRVDGHQRTLASMAPTQRESERQRPGIFLIGVIVFVLTSLLMAVDLP